MSAKLVAIKALLYALILAAALFVVAVWDYLTVTLHDHERRIQALEMTARPLIVVDKYSSVYLNGEPVPAPQEEGANVTLP